MSIRNKYLIGVVLVGVSCFAHADQYQEFYDDGYEAISEFRKCSTITNQLSQENANCLAKSEIRIQAKLKSFELKHKAKIYTYNQPSNNLVDSIGFVQSQKNQCNALYPEPLRGTFKNQIKSCQIQVDLNRFLYVANTVLGY